MRTTKEAFIDAKEASKAGMAAEKCHCQAKEKVQSG